MLSTSQLLVRRTRLVLVICLVGACIFTAFQASSTQALPGPSVLLHLLGIALSGLGLIVLQQPWVMRHALGVSMASVSIAYALTALARANMDNPEHGTTAILFVGAALTTAAIMPWGLWPQLATVSVAAAALAAAAYHADGTLATLGGDPAIAVIISFALSFVAAREVTRYRRGHRRELLDRRRAERAVRRLAARLEQRVSERTAALERAHEELHRHQAHLAHALRRHTIGEMASALAHEINQPLCAITNYAQGAVQRLRGDRVDLPALREACEQITHEGLRAGQILRSIRDLIREDTTISRDLDVNALASDAVRVIAPQAREHGVTVRLEGGANLPAIHADGAQIEQVMLNLMLNGVQAAALTRGARREVVVATTVAGGEVQVAVRDTGLGLAPDLRERLFTPFVTTKAHGLGLGLVISRSIVESHGGRLWTTPLDDDCTTFRFSLPAGAPPARAS